MGGPIDHSAGTVARSFLALGSGEAASRLIGFVATVYAARVLGAELFGVIAAAIAVVLYLNRVVDAGFELGLGVREVAADPGFLTSSAPTVLTVRTLMALVLAATAGALAIWLLDEPDGSILAVQALTLLAVGIGPRWAHLGLRRAGLPAVAATLGQLLMALLVVSLVRQPADAALVPAAQFLGDLTAAGILLVALRRIAGPMRVAIDWGVLRRLAGRAWHLVASALLGIAIYTAGILLLRAFQGAAAAGYYAAAYTLVTFAINVGAMYNLSLLPSLTSLAGSRDRQLALYHTSMAHLAGVGLPAAVGGALLAGPIIALVFGAGYRDAALPLGLLLWSLPLNFIRDVPLMALISGGNERVVFRITLAAAILSVTLGLALVPSYGIVGAAVGTLTSELVRMGLALALARRHGFPLPPVRRFLRTGGAALLMGLILCVTKPGSVWLAIPLGAACYLVGLVVTGALRVRWRQLPELRV